MNNEKISYTETEVEALTGLRVKTLQRWRLTMRGPRFVLLGRCVRYSQKGAAQSANRLLKDAKIRARVSGLQEAAAERAVEKAALNRAWVLDQLRENVERAMKATAPTDEHGRLCGEYRYEGSVANRALELIGKELGMFKDRISQEMTGGGTLEVVFVRSGERSGEEEGRGNGLYVVSS
jgi:hypothetical protein